jgi:hypothetical protein
VAKSRILEVQERGCLAAQVYIRSSSRRGGWSQPAGSRHADDTFSHLLDDVRIDGAASPPRVICCMA